MERKKMITIWSIGTAVLLLSMGVFSHDPGVFGNLAVLSTFLVAGPQLAFQYIRYRSFKEMEEKFPLFLRDITESIRSGMPLHKAIQTVSRFDYGSLSKEIRKMANQISWGVPADKVLDMFSNRVKKSKRMYTATKILRESYLSGGDIAAILDSVADNSEMLEEMEKDRKSVMSQYVLLMYAVSLIFVIIVIAVNQFLLPIFKTKGITSTAGLQNPCSSPIGFNKAICDLYGITAQTLFFMKEPHSISAYYTSLFFYMSAIQAIFSGLIAGQISEGSPKAGIIHSLILLGLVFGMYTIFIELHLIGV